MNEDEKLVLQNLADAWNNFCKLSNKDADDVQEFQMAVHSAQMQIALRVARRVNPEIWRCP